LQLEQLHEEEGFDYSSNDHVQLIEGPLSFTGDDRFECLRRAVHNAPVAPDSYEQVSSLLFGAGFSRYLLSDSKMGLGIRDDNADTFVLLEVVSMLTHLSYWK
jgi:hypothetical protein